MWAAATPAPLKHNLDLGNEQGHVCVHARAARARVLCVGNASDAEANQWALGRRVGARGARASCVRPSPARTDYALERVLSKVPCRVCTSSVPRASAVYLPVNART